MCFCTPSIRTPFCGNCNQAMFLRINELRAENAALKEHGQRDEQMFLDMLKVEGELREQLAAAQATIAEMREALETAITTPHMGQDIYTLKVQDAAREALAQPTNQDALHEARAVAVERLKDTPFFSADQKEYLAGVAAAHRARKEGR